jgi:hypothetical protein
MTTLAARKRQLGSLGKIMNIYRIQSSLLAGVLGAACLALTPLSLADTPTDSIAFPVSVIEARLLGPLNVIEAEQARPAIDGDRSIRVVLGGAEGEPPMAARWKPVASPGQGFNNEPRYELAAYQLQRLFLDECEYVVPPVVLRAMSIDEYKRDRPGGQVALRGTSSALFMLSYWLQDVTNRDPWDPARFKSDPIYARHWGNLNILTHLIEHKDANTGNLLISLHPEDPRVFAVDNDVAFKSEPSDRGDTWKNLQVDRLPASTIERLRKLTRADLDQALSVVAEFRIVNGLLEPVEPGANMNQRRGLDATKDRVQFGLNSTEINDIQRRIERLVDGVNRGRITAVEDSGESLGRACRMAAN